MRVIIPFFIVGLALIFLMGGTVNPTVNDGTAIKQLIDHYVGFVTDQKQSVLDENIFAADIVAFWSNGETYKGRAAVVKAHRDGRTEVLQVMKTLTIEPRNVTVRIKGNLAWMTCELHFNGIVKQGNQPLQRIVRSTFVFEKQGGRWQIVHEHSSRLTK